jgi:FAD/FMN-containing dehydrogenase
MFKQPSFRPDKERAESAHRSKVERVVAQLRAHRGDKPVSLRKKAVSHVVPKRDDKRHLDEKIDVSDLDEIIELDVENKTCTAEPGVTFTDLVDRTLPFGLVPIIVPELKTITIGGAVAGCSLESMSFKHGGFHDTCLEYELITASGEVLHCTPDNENQLLFQMIHGSFGTLGVLSKLKFKLIDAKPFVHLEHQSFRTLSEYKDAIWHRYQNQDVDFMDGFIHAPDKYVLSLGRFVDRAPYTNRYDWLKVYYQSTATRREDYLRTPDYFFRYDNGVTNVHPKSFLGRLLFGKFLHSAELLRIAERLHRFLPAEKPDLTVDLFVPFSRVDQFLDWYQREIHGYPLWCVPYHVPRRYEWIASDFLSGVDDQLFLDLAVYGVKQRPDRNDYKALEDALFEVRGIKTLISYNYYDEDSFWRTFNKPNYVAAKNRTDPRNIFRDVYSKTCRAALGL